MTASAPFTAAAELLAATSHRPLELGRPVGRDWWTLPAAAERAWPWYRELVAAHGDRRAAATFQASWLVGVPAELVGLPAVLVGATPVVAAEAIMVHRQSNGRFDALAIEPSDVVTDVTVLERAASQLVTLIAPLVARVTAELPVGAPALWSGLADVLSGAALRTARGLEQDERVAWGRTQLLLDSVAARVPQLRHRPRLFPVTWSGGVSHFQVRGTCCLYYRTQPAPDREGAGYCTTCPLRSDDCRDGLLRAHLEDAVA